ncbi:MAG: signal peptidase I [Aridibacter sp.]
MRNLTVCIIFVISFLSIGCGYHWVKVPTGAMQPTIKVDANVITDETAYSSRQPIKRFDIVIHKAPIDENMQKLGIDENTKFIFRVIGLSGEKVEIKNGDVFIDDKLLKESFEKIKSGDNFGPIIVPENEFFLLGDNRPESNDGRYWKPSTIKRENILGKVVKIF